MRRPGRRISLVFAGTSSMTNENSPTTALARTLALHSVVLSRPHRTFPLPGCPNAWDPYSIPPAVSYHWAIFSMEWPLCWGRARSCGRAPVRILPRAKANGPATLPPSESGVAIGRMIAIIDLVLYIHGAFLFPRIFLWIWRTSSVRSRTFVLVLAGTEMPAMVLAFFSQLQRISR